MTRRTFVKGLLVGVAALIVETESLTAQSFMDQPLDDWNHIVLTNNGNSSSLYLNGVLVSNIESRGRYLAVNLDGSIYISDNKDTSVFYHKSMDDYEKTTTSAWIKVKKDESITLDQLRIFNRPISSNEINILRNERREIEFPVVVKNPTYPEPFTITVNDPSGIVKFT